MIDIFIYFIVGLVLAFLIFWRLYFLRNPKRTIRKGNTIVSPADGKIIRIIEFNKKDLTIEKGLLGKIRTMTRDVADSGYLISIFMSPFDVHFQRAPVDGRIIRIRHEKGRFFAAFNFEKSLQNEKNEILIKSAIGNVKVIQVAGIFARRIKCFLKKGQKIKKGQIIGLIDLGSQVCILMPKLKLRIKEGQKVKGGETIIATY